MIEEDDDIPSLPADTLALVEAFKKAQEERESEAMQGEALPEEDWQLSQFWYSDDTATRLCAEVEAVFKDQEGGAEVALVSSPTLLPFFKKLEGFRTGRLRVKLFEYDARFGHIHPEEFVQYDYRSPLLLPPSLQDHFDLIIADPPFLADECLVKTAQTIRLIGKENARLILCTGAIMEEMAARLLSTHRLPFRPQHSNNLANDFASFANYETKTL